MLPITQEMALQLRPVFERIHAQNAEILADLTKQLQPVIANINAMNKALEPVLQKNKIAIQQTTKLINQSQHLTFPVQFTQQYSEIVKASEIFKTSKIFSDVLDTSWLTEATSDEEIEQRFNERFNQDEELHAFVEAIPQDSAFQKTALYLHFAYAWLGNVVRDENTTIACAWLSLIFGIIANYTNNPHLNSMSSLFGFLPAVLPKTPW